MSPSFTTNKVNCAVGQIEFDNVLDWDIQLPEREEVIHYDLTHSGDYSDSSSGRYYYGDQRSGFSWGQSQGKGIVEDLARNKPATLKLLTNVSEFPIIKWMSSAVRSSSGEPIC